jgi:RNA methyltransferase, rsmE family
MQLFYHPEVDQQSKNIRFNKDESQHIAKVLRKKEGDMLHITNGKGFLFTTQLSLASPKGCEVAILNSEKRLPLPYYLHLVVAPTKMNERYEWFLEKATEIGVSEVTPIICEHSERTTIKLERFEKIILSAMKQSLQCYLPVLNPPISSTDFFKNKQDDSIKFIAHCEDTAKQLLIQQLSPLPTRITILIGPEGDFSSEEINTALSQHFIPISLGKHRLRTETAAIVACHTVNIASLL